MINIDLDQTPINITEHIKRFRLFLISCWPHIDNLMEFHDWDDDGRLLDDWVDANWHLFVEREILEGRGILTPLSVPLFKEFTENDKRKYTIEVKITDKKFMDCFGFSSEVFLRFFCFCSGTDKGGKGLYPPFDLAGLVVDPVKQIHYIPFAFLDFYLVEYPIQQD